MSAFGAEGFDVRAERFTDPQTIQDQQRREGVLGRGAESGGDPQPADLVAV